MTFAKQIVMAMLYLMLLAVAIPEHAIGNVSNTNTFAWSETSGWLNFAPTGGGIAVYDDHLEGYVWGENIGWISMGSHTGGGILSYVNTNSSNWGVNRSGTMLSGFAWSETSGWINFKPTASGSGVTLDPATGIMDGWAWGENIGWIHIRNNAVGYAVLVSLPIISDLSGDTLSYRIGSATKVIDQGTAASVTNTGVSNFATGKLTVTFTGGATTADQLGILTSGSISVSLGSVYYDTGSGIVSIGTISNGANGNPLEVTFTINATPPRVSALLNNITYSNASLANVAQRTVSITVSNGVGGTSAPITATINLTRPGFHQLWG